MAWRAGNRQARSALRPRRAAAAIRLPAAKVFCIQWARMAPRKLSTARPITMPAAALTTAMRDTVSDEAEDADQRQRERHGREDAKQYREEPLAPVLCGARDGFIQGKGAVENAVGKRLAGGDGCDSGADGLQVSERIALGADEELRPGPHHGGVRNGDSGGHWGLEAVIARIPEHSDDLPPGRPLRSRD